MAQVSDDGNKLEQANGTLLVKLENGKENSPIDAQMSEAADKPDSADLFSAATPMDTDISSRSRSSSKSFLPIPVKKVGDDDYRPFSSDSESASEYEGEDGGSSTFKLKSSTASFEIGTLMDKESATPFVPIHVPTLSRPILKLQRDHAQSKMTTLEQLKKGVELALRAVRLKCKERESLILGDKCETVKKTKWEDYKSRKQLERERKESRERNEKLRLGSLPQEQFDSIMAKLNEERKRDPSSGKEWTADRLRDNLVAEWKSFRLFEDFYKGQLDTLFKNYVEPTPAPQSTTHGLGKDGKSATGDGTNAENAEGDSASTAKGDYYTAGGYPTLKNRKLTGVEQRLLFGAIDDGARKGLRYTKERERGHETLKRYLEKGMLDFFSLFAKISSSFPDLIKLNSRSLGLDVNQLYPWNLYDETFRWNLLHSACHAGNFEAVKLIVAKGAEVEAQDGWYGSVRILPLQHS